MTTRIDVFIDYVCPYCLLAEGAIEALRRERDVQVKLQPFELRPDPVPTLRPEENYLPSVWRSSVYPMARRLGVPISLPTISPQPRTEKAFLVLQLAEERGQAAPYSHAMFAAFFQQNRDIGRDEVIIDMATSVGLDRSEVEAALTSPERRVRHAEELRYAAETVGVTGVPSFLINGRLVSGVADLARLTAAVDRFAAAEVLR
ncbi:DsbA family oxidoreductase [Salinispora cortesiana]|uniref:DsbA family oxidoreductase n=1 Tax=Salinispora cortesiana TaxID=1305843 RepID=UPI00041E3EE6|nr:DsbA family protein [Salinispora cortesiana]